MARIAVLELPAEQVGELYRTPYLLIIDQVDPETIETMRAGLDAFLSSTGARGILVFEQKVDVT